MRSICGRRLVVVAAGEAVGRGGMSVRLTGYGMPVRTAGSQVERGDLRVEVRLRSLREELRFGGRLATTVAVGGATCWSILRAAGGLRGLARIAGRALGRTLKLWLRITIGLLSLLAEPRVVVFY